MARGKKHKHRTPHFIQMKVLSSDLQMWSVGWLAFGVLGTIGDFLFGFRYECSTDEMS